MTTMTIQQRIDKVSRIVPAMVRKRMRSLEYAIRVTAMGSTRMKYLNHCADQLIDLLAYSEKVASIRLTSGSRLKCAECPARGTNLIHLRCQYVCKVRIPDLDSYK